MFATIVEFNNFIGAPVNTYKIGYSRLKFFRKIFFDKVQNIPDLDKYIGIYKWIDDALDSILFNLLPASANASEKVRTIIENHILERSKISYPLAPDQGVVTTGGEKMLKVNNMANSPDLSKPLRDKEAVQEHIGKYDNTIPGYSPPQGGYSTKFEKTLTPISSNNSGRRTITIAGTAAARAGRK